MGPKSHTLFHFTKSSNTLKAILSGGYWPRYCLEDVRWVGQRSEDYIAFPMVCFCDIPLSRISEHIVFYGSYGLGMTKEWASQNGLNPVLYLSQVNDLSRNLCLLNVYANLLSEDNREKAKKTMRYIYAHIKPLSGNMIVGKHVVVKEFLQESEWRYVPCRENVTSYLKQKDFDSSDILEGANEASLANAKLEFTPKDVKYIFVPADSDIPDLVNFIQEELDNFPAADLKVLLSRIISIESVSRDL